MSIWLAIFFLAGIPAFLFELAKIHDPKSLSKNLESVDNVESKENVSASQGCFALLNLFYYAWLFVGLLTPSRMFFLGILILAFIPKKAWWFVFIDGIITLCLLIGSIFYAIQY